MLNELTLQRCVDGELSESEHHEFLQTVDQTSDGWRTLALAYSEEQIWGAAVSPACGDVVAQPVVAAATSVPQKDSHSRVSLTTLALSLLVALTSGLICGDIWREARTTTAMANRPMDSPGSSGLVNANSVSPRVMPSNVTPSIPAVVDPRQQQNMTVDQYVLDVMGADGQVHQVQYPVYDSPDLVPTYRPQLPVAVREELLRSGYQVRRRQQMRMVPQDNGEQILFSIELLRAEPIQ